MPPNCRSRSKNALGSFQNQKQVNIPSTASIRNLSDVIRGLSAVSGKAIPKVIDHEMERTLEKCISLTPAANVEKIQQNFDSRQFTTFDKKRFRISGKGMYGKQKKPHGNRYPDALWNAILEARKKSLIKKISLRGLSKQSWFRLAEMLGYTAKVAKYVSRIPARFNSNFDVSRTVNDGSYIVGIRNAQPTINRIGGKGIVKRAISGRVNYFRKNMENGVLDDMEKFSKAYPGLVKINTTGGLLE